MFVIEMGLLQILYSVVLPIIVGIVTKQLASSQLKSVALLFLSVLGVVVAQAIGGGGVFTSQMIVESVITFVIATASYYGVWKPTGVAETVQEKTSAQGIG
jgi:hypothetical protein